LGQKIKDTLAFNQRVVAQIVFTFTFFQALEPRSFYSHQSSGTKHAKQMHEYNQEQYINQKETLKERTKG
jgi:inorganic pyrophosphatase